MSLFHHQAITLGRRGVSRRSFLHCVSAGAVAAGTLDFRDLMSVHAAELRKQGMSMILLWMQGGPSQFETFDPKPGTENGGPTEAIETAVPGIRIAQGWEKTAQVIGDIALIRSMTNKEGEHQRATYQMHTGYIPTGTVRHPSLGCSIAKELSVAGQELPAVVSVGGGGGPGGVIGSGFLGVEYDPFMVQVPGELPRNVALNTDKSRYDRRLGLLGRLENDFAEQGGDAAVADHQRLYEKTRKLVLSPEVKAFEIAGESTETRAAYGDTPFGKGCLLARRLVESGVTFIEVRHGNWDTHQDNFTETMRHAGQVDPAMAALIADLKQRGLLDRTLVVWMGEFGRTPRINPRTGRDHYPRSFNVALAGGGIKGGQVIGSTSNDGTALKDDPVTVQDLFSSICKSLKVNPAHENLSPVGRPLKIVDGGQPVAKLFG
ncbi:MAG: DUF1501 domain-containing protein [Planctomycetaceae bacterium]|nr:DUF1501 domain-containing protein [Planctomycetaceae bacterium]